jgi:hypothetical protein
MLRAGIWGEMDWSDYFEIGIYIEGLKNIIRGDFFFALTYFMGLGLFFIVPVVHFFMGPRGPRIWRYYCPVLIVMVVLMQYVKYTDP